MSSSLAGGAPWRRVLRHLQRGAAPLFLSSLAWAHDPFAQSVEISGHYDNRVGTSDAASQGVIGAALLNNRPLLRPGEVLELVPGLVVTQHSGDGKANQYFLRGFNLDHGTDFATHLNGMPVNLPTHGHGHGYSDLNFLLPELVQRVHYQKGPYHARSGDFAAAGAADFVYRNRLDAPLVQLSLGQHRYRRAVLAGSIEWLPGITALAAVEVMGNDGPWTLPQGLRRRNGVFTLSGGTAAQGWQASVMAYSARWAATDQVPQRLVDGDLLDGRPFGRFDAVDTSDGGDTGRSSLSFAWHQSTGEHTTRVQAYAMQYRLALHSNFTYALERPDEGDQFLQRDRRKVVGLSATRSADHQFAGRVAHSEWGLQWRHDRIRVGLADTVQRRLVRTTRDDQVQQHLLGLWGQTDWELTPSLRLVAGLRADHIANRVTSLSDAANSGRASATQLSPKLSLVASPWNHTELFANVGRGLHSNDARGTTITRDPKSGAEADKVPPLVAVKGYELGLRTEVLPGLQSSIALWTLRSASELVYIGDAGATEASAASRRSGIELNQRWQATRQLLIDADLALNHARFANGERIPNAVDRVATLGATVQHLGPWRASIQWRYLGAGALVEDNSARSQAAITTSMRLGLDLAATWPGRFGKGSELALDVFNLGNRKINDIQYYYESRLPGEASAVTDRHVHPAEPRNLRLSLRVAL
jgi:hypothetical protein